MRKPILSLLLSAAAVVAMTGCGSGNNKNAGPNSTVTPEALPTAATAPSSSPGATPSASPSSSSGVEIELKNGEGSVVGTARFTQENKGVRIQVQATKLAPGEHGLHVHESGVCAGPDFKTAGGHFNPNSNMHGMENPQGPHVGDLPNLKAEANGEAKLDTVSEAFTLEKDKPNSLLKQGGTSLVIHEKQDDMKSDPAGNSGNRIACGTISEGK
ncbi:superoxide dismutase family protein [Paenibacillus chitinolyticus]|uniref:superoxide dismutase family protein n=1 Tax=Paenibacillus chitinolyticus TaxID=79263 RepID=UPI0036341471